MANHFITKFDAIDPQLGALAALECVIEIPILDASADTDTVMPFAVRVIEAVFQATGIAAHATNDTWQLKNTATAITEAVAKTATVEAITRNATCVAAQRDIPAGGILRVTAVKATNAAGKLFVRVKRTDIP